jgi:hypothetical protein
MTVKTAALPRQQLDTSTVAVPRRRYERKDLVAFVMLVGVVELGWLVLLFELVRRFV